MIGDKREKDRKHELILDELRWDDEETRKNYKYKWFIVVKWDYMWLIVCYFDTM